MAFREISPSYSKAVDTIDPRIVTNTLPPDAFTSEQKAAQDYDDQHLDFFTVTPSMDAFQASFCAQSALWLDSPPTIPSKYQFDRWLNSAGVLPKPYSLRGPCYTPSMEASTSQSHKRSNTPLVLPQGTSGTTWPLIASPDPSSSSQEPSYRYQAIPQLVNPQLTTQDVTLSVRRSAGTPAVIIRRSGPLRKDSLASPPPSVRRSSRLKARVKYNYDPLPAEVKCEGIEDQACPKDEDTRPISSSKVTKKKKTTTTKKKKNELYLPDGRCVFVCDEGECSNPSKKAMTFTRKADLTRHNNSVHEKIQKFRCRGCDKAFPRGDALTRHERACHKLRDIIRLMTR